MEGQAVRIVVTLLILSPVVLFALEALDPWPQAAPPQALVGAWEGETRSFVQRWYAGGRFGVFFNLHEDRTAEGTVGDARLQNALFRRNRGWLGRMLHMASDYVIEAELEGSLMENVQCGRVTISLNFDETGLQGSVECSECGEGGRGQRWITSPGLTFTRAKEPFKRDP